MEYLQELGRKLSEPKTDLGRRLRELRMKFGSDDIVSFSKLLGIGKSALAYYERGENVPDAVVLSAYREKVGVNLHWLLSGQGSMFDDISTAPAPTKQVDPVLMEKLYKAVERAYRSARQKPPGHRLAHEATTLFNVLLSRVADVRDKTIVDAVIPVLAKELVEKLSEADDEPGTGKRSAS